MSGVPITQLSDVTANWLSTEDEYTFNAPTGTDWAADWTDSVGSQFENFGDNQVRIVQYPEAGGSFVGKAFQRVTSIIREITLTSATEDFSSVFIIAKVDGQDVVTITKGVNDVVFWDGTFGYQSATDTGKCSQTCHVVPVDSNDDAYASEADLTAALCDSSSPINACVLTGQTFRTKSMFYNVDDFEYLWGLTPNSDSISVKMLTAFDVTVYTSYSQDFDISNLYQPVLADFDFSSDPSTASKSVFIGSSLATNAVGNDAIVALGTAPLLGAKVTKIFVNTVEHIADAAPDTGSGSRKNVK